MNYFGFGATATAAPAPVNSSAKPMSASASTARNFFLIRPAFEGEDVKKVFREWLKKVPESAQHRDLKPLVDAVNSESSKDSDILRMLSGSDGLGFVAMALYLEELPTLNANWSAFLQEFLAGQAASADLQNPKDGSAARGMSLLVRDGFPLPKRSTVRKILGMPVSSPPGTVGLPLALGCVAGAFVVGRISKR